MRIALVVVDPQSVARMLWISSGVFNAGPSLSVPERRFYGTVPLNATQTARAVRPGVPVTWDTRGHPPRVTPRFAFVLWFSPPVTALRAVTGAQKKRRP